MTVLMEDNIWDRIARLRDRKDAMFVSHHKAWIDFSGVKYYHTYMENRIVFDPKILQGKPIIKNTRISVEFILGLLASGMGPADIVSEYPQLKPRDIQAAIAYAAKTIQREDVVFAHP